MIFECLSSARAFAKELTRAPVYSIGLFALVSGLIGPICERTSRFDLCSAARLHPIAVISTPFQGCYVQDRTEGNRLNVGFVEPAAAGIESIRWLDIDHRTDKAISGGHFRAFVMWWSLLSNDGFKQKVRYALCAPGPLRLAMGVETQPDGVFVRDISKDRVVRSRYVSCLK